MMKIKYIGKCLLLEENDERVLVVGDLHLGYEGSLRNSGVMIPVDLYKQVIEDFEEIFEYLDNFRDEGIVGDEKLVNNKKNLFGVVSGLGKLLDNKIKEGAKDNIGKNNKGVNECLVKKDGRLLDKIILLGDVKHEFGSILKEEWEHIGKLLVYLKKKCRELIVIEGNHDKILFPILKNVNANGSDFFIWNCVGFMHGDKSFAEVGGRDIKYWVVGHGHPAVVISDGTKKEKYKCFLIGEYKLSKGNKKMVIIVPSFFPLIEGTDAREFEMSFAWDFELLDFDVGVVNGLEVLGFGKLRKI